MSPIAEFFVLTEAFCAAAACAEATLSTRMLGDGKRLAAIRAGSDIGARRLAQAIQWLSDNWPADAAWPAVVQRPAAKSPASEPEAAA